MVQKEAKEGPVQLLTYVSGFYHQQMTRVQILTLLLLENVRCSSKEKFPPLSRLAFQQISNPSSEITMASTYPGVIPYRSHSPSQREYADNQVPQLIKVSNPNFSLKRPPSMASASRNPQNEEELREQYYEYWLQQVSKSVKSETYRQVPKV